MPDEEEYEYVTIEVIARIKVLKDVADDEGATQRLREQMERMLPSFDIVNVARMVP